MFSAVLVTSAAPTIRYIDAGFWACTWKNEYSGLTAARQSTLGVSRTSSRGTSP